VSVLLKKCQKTKGVAFVKKETLNSKQCLKKYTQKQPRGKEKFVVCVY